MLIKKFKDWKIGIKFAVTATILVMFSVIALGLLVYDSVKKSTFKNIETQLKSQALDWQKITLSTYYKIQEEIVSAEKISHSIVSSQAEVLYHFITSNLTMDKEELKKTLAGIKVGKTGYVYVLDYEGNYIVSKDRLRDGENLWQEKDEKGNYFIQKIIDQGKALSGNRIAFSTHPWKNTEESESRDKLAAIIHIPQYKWIIGIGTYLDEVVDTDFSAKYIEELKAAIAAQRIGKTGYIYVLDDEGNYLVSKDRLRDGENIWQAKDAKGSYFIREIIEKAKKLGINNSAVYYYPWKNIGERKTRMKIAGISYVAPLNWTIGVSAYHEDFLDAFNDIKNKTMAVIVVAIIVVVFIAFCVSQIITRPIDSLLNVSKIAGEGNLGIQTKIESQDEVGELGNGFNRLIRNLADVILQIKTSTEQVASQGEGLSTSVEQLNASAKNTSLNIQKIAQGAKAQSSKMNEISQIMESIVAALNKVFSNTQSTAAASEKTTKIAETGAVAVNKTFEKMSEIADIVSNSAGVIIDLNKMLKEIDEFVNIITNISDQTNLLSLNAAIEAARAGESGRGFAVVAEEIRNLAENSSSSADKITQLISRIQAESAKAINAMYVGKEAVIEGKKITNEAKNALEEITNEIKEVTGMIVEIAVSAKKQMDGTRQIMRKIDEVAEVSRDSAISTEEVSSLIREQTASMEELASSSQRLNQVSSDLNNIVGRFKFGEDDSLT